jgi:hypothetical protein
VPISKAGGIAKPDLGVAGPSAAEPDAGTDGPGLAAGVADRPIAGRAKPDGGVRSVGDTNSAEAAVGGGAAWDGVGPPETPKGGAPKGTDGAELAVNPAGGNPNGAGVSPVIGDLVGFCAGKPVGGVGSGVACGLRPAKPELGKAAPGKPAGAGSGVLGCVGAGS